MNNNKGFSLIELIVVVVIVGVVAAIAVPSYVSLVNGNRMSVARTGLANMIAFARSEALTKNAEIVLKAKNDDWNQGATVENSSGTTLRILDLTSDFYDIKSQGDIKKYTFTRKGYLKELTGEINICMKNMVEGYKVDIKASGVAHLKSARCS